VAYELMDHARAELPNEACGFISGSLAAGQATAFHTVRNVAASPLRYEMDPEDQVRVTFAIEDAGEELVAIFHSHTRSAAVPSATDRRTAIYPDAFHLLASLTDPDAPPARALRAWRIFRGHAFEVPLRLE
jgi:proteasome lid subunit RPN8/RPN11